MMKIWTFIQAKNKIRKTGSHSGNNAHPYRSDKNDVSAAPAAAIVEAEVVTLGRI